MGKGIIHSNETKIRCAYLYASLGNYSQVARDTKIARKTIHTWSKDSEVWHDSLLKARQEISDELLAQHMESARLSGIELKDRIINGDHKLVQGEVIRLPMTGKDLAVVNGIQVDKGRVSMGLATNITSNNTQASMMEFLEQCADAYRDKQASVVSVQHTTSSDSKDKD